MSRLAAALHRTREVLRTPLGGVVGGVAGPLLLTVPVELWANEPPFRPGLLYVAFVAVLAAYGGLVCGVAAAITSLVVTWFVTFRPKYTLVTRTGDDVVSLILVALSLGAVLVVVWRLDLARQRAADARRASADAERRERLLLDIASALGAARDRDEVKAVLRTTVAPATGAASIALLEVGDGPTHADLVMGYDLADPVDSSVPGEQQWSALSAVVDGVPLYLDEPELARAATDIAATAAMLGERARATVPFELVGGRGAVAFGFTDRQDFPREHRRFLETIGLLVGSTLRRIDAVSRSEEHKLAVAFDAMLHGVGLYRAVRDEGGTVVDFEIRHLNRQATEMVRRGTETTIGRSFLDSFPHLHDEGLFAALVQVLDTGEPFLRDPWWSHALPGEPVPFTVQVTKSASDEVLVVMSDVRAREEARRTREEALVRAARDRAVISRLEDALLPDELPALADHGIAGHYRAAAHAPVGGDWYDAVALPNGDLAFTVGDVAGHGLDATATMVFARSAVRALLVDGMPVDEALRRVDGILASQGAFVTCWAAIYSAERGTATIASAGHLPALLGDGRSVCVLGTPVGPPLGVDTSRRPGPTTVVVPDGGFLLAYTDGLVERRGASIDDGIARLVAALDVDTPRDDPTAWLARVVERAMGDDTATDDLCALALVRKPGARPPRGTRRFRRPDEPGSDEAEGPDDDQGVAVQARAKLAALVAPWRERVRRFPFTS